MATNFSTVRSLTSRWRTLLTAALASALVASAVTLPPSQAFAGTAETYPDEPATETIAVEDGNHFLPDHADYLIRFDDGNNHGAEYAPEIRDMIQREGQDILITTNSGKVVNLSWTFNDMRNAWLAKKDSPEESEAVRTALNDQRYTSFFNPTRTQGTTGLGIIDFVLREDNQTGDLNLVIPFAGSWRNTGFNPGDTLYRSVKFHVNDGAAPIVSRADVAMFVFELPVVKGANGDWQASNQYRYGELRDLVIDGTPSPVFDSRESQITVDAAGKESAVWQNFYNRSTDGDHFTRHFQFAYDVPKDQLVQVQFRNNFRTTGISNSATTVFTRQQFERIPQVEVHHVLDKNYRELMGYEPTAALLTRPNKVALDRNADAAAPRQQRVGYLPLGIDELAPSVEAYNLQGLRVSPDSPFEQRLMNHDFPNYPISPTSEEWANSLNATVPGYVFVDDDLPDDTNLTYTYLPDPVTGEVLLRQHLYRTYRSIPGAVEIAKSDAATEAALAGAEFELWSADHTTKLTEATFTTDASGKVRLYNGDLAALADDESVRQLPQADSHGIIVTENGLLLEPGSYSLREVTVPEGYETPSEQAAFTDFTVAKRATEQERISAVSVGVTNTPVPGPSEPEPSEPEPSPPGPSESTPSESTPSETTPSETTPSETTPATPETPGDETVSPVPIPASPEPAAGLAATGNTPEPVFIGALATLAAGLALLMTTRRRNANNLD